MNSCAESNAKRVSLELGGKSPLIIFGDCDVDKAVRQVCSPNHHLLFFHPFLCSVSHWEQYSLTKEKIV